MSKFVIQHLESEIQIGRSHFITCSFLCRNGNDSLGDSNSILLRIIFQVVSKQRNLERYVKPLLNEGRDGVDLRRSFDRLWSIFTAVVSNAESGYIYIIIDALDECEGQSRKRFLGSVADLINVLASAQTSVCIKFLITSRPYLAIHDFFQGKPYQLQCLALEDRRTEVDGDLGLVVTKRVGELANRIQADQETIKLLEEYLNTTADQNFLWVSVILDFLDNFLLTSPRDIQRVLKKLPRNFDKFYEQFLQGLKPQTREPAFRLLGILIGSRRPLTIDEVNHVFSIRKLNQTDCRDLVSLKTRHLHRDIATDIRKVLGPLVRISGSKVYLVHTSLKEFLCPSEHEIPGNSNLLPDKVDVRQAELILATACMTYLALDDFSADLYSEQRPDDNSASLSSGQDSRSEADLETDGVSVDDYVSGYMARRLDRINDDTISKVEQRFVLFGYAAAYWPQHFKESQELAGEALRNLALKLSDRQSSHNFSNWFRYHCSTQPFLHKDISIFDQILVAGCFGHYTSLKTILGRSDIHCSAESLTYALVWAVQNADDRSVHEILRQAHVFPDKVTFVEQSPLCSAAAKGNLGIVKALIEDGRADINFKGFLGGTPLWNAAGSGCTEIVKYLLMQKHVDVNAEDVEGFTPLSEAISDNRFDAVVALIEDPRVNVNHADRYGRTPFTFSVCNGDESILALLLRSPGINIKTADDLGRTPFSYAAEEGRREIVELLLRIPGIDVKASSNSGLTPLAYAAMKGRLTVIQQLKQRKRLDRSHSHQNADGRNAISLAAGGGFDEVIQELVKCSVPGVNESDKNRGWTPLFWALEANHISTFKLLLSSKRVNVNHQDHTGRTPLSWAVSYGNEESLRLLLGAPKVDPSVPDNEGLTPLDWAEKSESGPHMAEILEELLRSKG